MPQTVEPAIDPQILTKTTISGFFIAATTTTESTRTKRAIRDHDKQVPAVFLPSHDEHQRRQGVHRRDSTGLAQCPRF